MKMVVMNTQVDIDDWHKFYVETDEPVWTHGYFAVSGKNPWTRPDKEVHTQWVWRKRIPATQDQYYYVRCDA